MMIVSLLKISFLLRRQVLYVFCLYSGVSIAFTAEYMVGEQENQFDVCVVLSGAIETNVTVALSAQENDQLLPNTRATSRLFTHAH